MSDERENRAWHIAGHAWAGMTFGFPVRFLDLDGISEAQVEAYKGSQRLDPWTLLSVSPCDKNARSRTHEHLIYTAFAGPSLELLHRKIPCTVDRVRVFESDWQQAWRSGGYLYGNDQERLAWLTRFAENSTAIMIDPPTQAFVQALVPILLERGRLTAIDVAMIWTNTQEALEEEANRIERPSRKKPRRQEIDPWPGMWP